MRPGARNILASSTKTTEFEVQKCGRSNSRTLTVVIFEDNKTNFSIRNKLDKDVIVGGGLGAEHSAAGDKWSD